MRKLASLVFIGLLVFIGIYLVWPTPDLPEPPPGSLKSVEPADTETVLRQAFYTDLSRADVIAYYKQAFRAPLQIRLNHPPEDAAVVIRDQTRSNYLEELVHPGKEALFINGFVPEKIQDTIVRNGKVYKSKITVHMVPSGISTRLTVLLMLGISAYLLARELKYA